MVTNKKNYTMRKLLLFACALFGFMACTQNPIEEQSAIRIDAPETLRVGFEDDETRIQLNSAQKTVWTKNDQVSVFYLSDANQKWQYNGETGTRTAELKRVDAGNATETMKRVVVVYPYNDNYYINTDTYNVKASLPAVQNYLKDSYGTNGNIMISSSEYNQFSLKSVCGWLKLQLTGDGEVVKSIKFRGNDDEQVAGELYINSADATAMLASDMGGTDDNNAGGNLVFDDTILTEVVLDCGEGVTLGKSATVFYIALPPQTFANGFTVEIEDTDGYAMEQPTAKTFVVERNTISPMSALVFVNPNRPTQPTPANNEIWYTATAKVEPTFDDSLTFGADVVSNVWDSETKRGIITFNGDVTMIGDDAFNNCDKFTGIILPECVTSIGKNAFYSCDGLTEFIIPDSVTTIGNEAFSNCSSLTSVTIPDSVTTIRGGAFRWCDSLTSVTIPDSVTTIGDAVFSDCTSLKEFKGKFAEDNGRILVIDGVLVAFVPEGLTEYTIPISVTTIGGSVFSWCRSLISVTIPDSVTTIGEWAFSGCSSLISVTIPDSVTTIGDFAFYECTSLKKVYCNATIPPSLGSHAFSSNANGRRIYVYEECVELYKSAWSSYIDSIYTNGQNCPDTTTIVYTTTDGNTITSSELPIISNSYDNGVGTMVISGIITVIPDDAFRNCSSLTSVTIPNSVTWIGGDAFYRCSSLTSVTIPDSVTTIGYQAFYGCRSLTSVYCSATTPPSLGDNAFQYSLGGRYLNIGCDIYVPTESIEAYKSASGWSEYASDIVGYNF